MHINNYESSSVNKLILRFSLPAIFSLLVEMMTSVVDTSFAGHLGSSSESALAAMGLLSPLFTSFVALQTLFAISTAIMISKYLGRNDRLTLNKYFQNGFIMTIVISISSSILVLFFMDPLLRNLGATEEVYTQAVAYLKIILVSNLFSAIGYTLTSTIRAFGNPKVEALIVTLSVIINVVFNAILTFGFQLGISGIALGTLISEVICALLSITFLIKNKSWFSWTNVSIKEHFLMAYQLFKIGFAQTAIQLLAGVSALIVNHQLLVTGGTLYLAIWNVANKIYLLMLMPIIGITQSVQTIIAYFDGKGAHAKKNETVTKTIYYSFFYGIAITIIVFLLGHQLLRLFTFDPLIQAPTMNVIRVIFSTFPLLGITFTIMTLLQVTGKEMHAVLLGIIRQVLAIVPLVIILPYLFSKQIIGGITPAFSLFFAIPLADLFTLGVAILFFKKTKSPIRT